MMHQIHSLPKFSSQQVLEFQVHLKNNKIKLTSDITGWARWGRFVF